MAPRERASVLGVPVDPVNWGQLVALVEQALASSTPLTVLYANVHVVNQARRHPGLQTALERADVVYCDGEGVRLGARWLGEPQLDRMTGADFLYPLMAWLAARGAGVFWLGAPPGVAEEALRRLGDRTPGLDVRGSQHGFFDDGEADALVARINASGARVVFVGLGTPRQELWVTRHRAALQADVVWCLGATAEFVAGTMSRGPGLLSAHGFEWLGRLLSEPRRLFGRYVGGLPLFLARVLLEVLRRRLAR